MGARPNSRVVSLCPPPGMTGVSALGVVGRCHFVFSIGDRTFLFFCWFSPSASLLVNSRTHVGGAWVAGPGPETVETKVRPLCRSSRVFASEQLEADLPGLSVPTGPSFVGTE